MKTKQGKLKIKRKLKDEELLRGPSRGDICRVSAAFRIAEAILRVMLSVLAILACLILVSCSAIPGYSEPEDRFIVSALGFDVIDGAMRVSAQIVAGEGEPERVCVGKGESVEQAMAHIEGADAKQLETSHCALILIGDSVEKEALAEILDYCRRNDDITIGAKVASAHDAGALLSLEGADGYELLGALRESSDGAGFAGGSRFYEIEEIRASKKEGAVYHLPYFSADGEIYTVAGLKIFKDDGAVVRLDRSESAYYMMIKDEFDGGSADFEYNGRQDSVYVRGCKTDYKTDGEGFYVTCHLDVNSELLGELDRDKVMTACSERAQRLCRELTERYGDIFGFNENDPSGIFVKCEC